MNVVHAGEDLAYREKRVHDVARVLPRPAPAPSITRWQPQKYILRLARLAVIYELGQVVPLGCWDANARKSFQIVDTIIVTRSHAGCVAGVVVWRANLWVAPTSTWTPWPPQAARPLPECHCLQCPQSPQANATIRSGPRRARVAGAPTLLQVPWRPAGAQPRLEGGCGASSLHVLSPLL